VANPEDPKMRHISVAGGTYTILMTGEARVRSKTKATDLGGADRRLAALDSRSSVAARLR
jgi:hypothetical protein